MESSTQIALAIRNVVGRQSRLTREFAGLVYEVRPEKCAVGGHGNWITSIAFSPDGKQLASSSFDRTIRLWDLAEAATVETFRGHDGTVWTVRFTPDGKAIATGSQDGSVKMWEVPQEARVRRF